jgi:hypothetical protein
LPLNPSPEAFEVLRIAITITNVKEYHPWEDMLDDSILENLLPNHVLSRGEQKEFNPPRYCAQNAETRSNFCGNLTRTQVKLDLLARHVYHIVLWYTSTMPASR